MTENDIAPQKVYCKNCRYYCEAVDNWEYSCSAHCAYVEYNSFNREVNLLGELRDNEEGTCPHYLVLPIKQSFWKSLFNKE